MARRDKQIAAGSVAVLWLLFGFVFWQIAGLVMVTAPGVVVLSGIVGASILILNTASIYRMIRRCSCDTTKARIYGPEVQSVQIEDGVSPNVELP
ncbi:hypothetical protein [Methyloceanibacter sp.]|uniref:hypothetical protein n=1 Tax=Methyloceanibacter sp. TaxID=1965321 RepID=UPI00208B5084|nr:hypothetical protein [Methyloceanibacter sp.]GFO82819.1 MAG: hypothetical protein A49_24460 [Methyloceanibacter sp.]HML91085.1 hypothetical protein [Methyloceanibacter sp.]